MESSCLTVLVAARLCSWYNKGLSPRLPKYCTYNVSILKTHRGCDVQRSRPKRWQHEWNACQLSFSQELSMLFIARLDDRVTFHQLFSKLYAEGDLNSHPVIHKSKEIINGPFEKKINNFTKSVKVNINDLRRKPRMFAVRANCTKGLNAHLDCYLS